MAFPLPPTVRAAGRLQESCSEHVGTLKAAFGKLRDYFQNIDITSGKGVSVIYLTFESISLRTATQ